VRILRNRGLFFLCTVLFSLLFTKYYFLSTHEHYEPSSSERMADFTADKVFQKRVLPILLAKGMVSLTGISIDHALKGCCVVSCIALLYGFGALVQVTGTPDAHPVLTYILFLPVGWNYIAINGIYHSYDLPSLAFFCWGIVLFLRRRYAWFYLLYAMASLNRESTCFITIALCALLLHNPTENLSAFRLGEVWKHNRNLVIHCAGQTVLWFLMKTSLEYVFRDNPGTYYEQTYSMFGFLRDAWAGKASWPYLAPDTILGNPRCFFTLFAGLWLLVPFLWPFVPGQTKKLLWIVPPYLFAAILYANLMETRVYHELNIVLTACAVAGLHGWWRTRCDTTAEVAASP
jgi:hypothetical protein